MAHHSRLAGFIIDSRSDDLDTTARFWSAALGLRVADPDSGGTGQYAEFAGVPGDLPEEVFQRADQALYRAKAGGRDRVVVDDTERVDR